jgi:hypothetical protein
VIKHVVAVELRIVLPKFSPPLPMPFSSHTTSQSLMPIWLSHWPAFMGKVLREETA